MRLNFKESDLNSLWVKLFLFHCQSFVKLTQEPPLCLPFLTSQSALRIFLVGLGFWLLRTLQGPIWLTKLTIRFCLFLCFGLVFFELNVELEVIILDHLVNCLHFTSDINQSDRQDLLRMWQNWDCLLAIRSRSVLSPVIPFQNLESYKVRTKRFPGHLISGSQTFYSSGK